MGYLAAADAAQLDAETQAACLRGLEQTDAIATAVRASFLAAFTVGKGYSADAGYSARAGQPVKVWAHILLADLLRLDGSSALQEQWTAQVRARWAARRAHAAETGADGGAWLDGDAAEGIACDAAMAPIVTGDVNVAALGDLVRLCVELDARQRDGARDAAWAALEQAVIGKTMILLLHSQIAA